MFMTRSDYKTPDGDLYNKIQAEYKKYFFPEIPYTCKLDYNNVVNYGFSDFQYKEYKTVREFNADDFVSYIGTHSDHITLNEPYKTNLFEGIKKVIRDTGDKIVIFDTIALYLAKKA